MKTKTTGLLELRRIHEEGSLEGPRRHRRREIVEGRCITRALPCLEEIEAGREVRLGFVREAAAMLLPLVVQVEAGVAARTDTGIHPVLLQVEAEVPSTDLLL